MNPFDEQFLDEIAQIRLSPMERAAVWARVAEEMQTFPIPHSVRAILDAYMKKVLSSSRDMFLAALVFVLWVLSLRFFYFVHRPESSLAEALATAYLVLHVVIFLAASYLFVLTGQEMLRHRHVLRTWGIPYLALYGYTIISTVFSFTLTIHTLYF